jgi:uncharacterized protein with gpF-like domain
MVTMLKMDGAKSWREAASQSSKGRIIFNALKNEMHGPVGDTIRNLVHENAKLISTMPLNLAEQATTFITEESQKGRRADDITQDLIKQFPHVSEVNIRRIARTEVSKASTALTQARSQFIGAGWYTWQTSRDIRVRASHKFLGRDGGVLINWNNPPSPEELVGEKSYGAWPHLVYFNGQVKTMTRHQFSLIAGMEEAA